MIRANTDPSTIGGLIIDAIGEAFPELFIDKIIDTHFFRLAFWLILTAGMVKIPEKFLLLRIHRNHGLASLLKSFDLRMNIMELGITSWVRRTFRCLAGAWQTITKMISQLRDLRMTDRIPFRGQLRR
jgi:hypothetical protein